MEQTNEIPKQGKSRTHPFRLLNVMNLVASVASRIIASTVSAQSPRALCARGTASLARDGRSATQFNASAVQRFWKKHPTSRAQTKLFVCGRKTISVRLSARPPTCGSLSCTECARAARHPIMWRTAAARGIQWARRQ